MSVVGDSLLLALWRNLHFLLFCVLEMRLSGGENIVREDYRKLFIKRLIVLL